MAEISEKEKKRRGKEEKKNQSIDDCDKLCGMGCPFCDDECISNTTSASLRSFTILSEDTASL